MSRRTTQQTLVVAGMHGGACAMAIDMELEELPGVAEARTSFARATVDVVFDAARVDVDTIIATIGRAGYTARPIPTGSR